VAIALDVRIIHADCRAAIPELVAEGVPVDAIVTDPPYHLGFMGQTWDGGDIAFRPETWAAMLPALKPGGFVLAFGGTRTHHRLWCAIEDAGLVIQDTISWLYGSGFPKGRMQLKPAWEPIVVAYKPGGKRTLQIDECRVGIGHDRVSGGPRVAAKIWSDWDSAPGKHERPTGGRWPANLCHDGSDEVLEAFAAFGEKNDRPHIRHNETMGYGGAIAGFQTTGPGDIGTAARFFYSAKADRLDRWGSHHPTVKPIALLRWLVRLVTPPGGIVLDPFAGSGTIGAAAFAEGRNAIMIEADADHIADIRERMAFYEGMGRHSLVSKNRNRREVMGTLL
jgi:site-specific DNA-methyltransferase (adenine-specific)